MLDDRNVTSDEMLWCSKNALFFMCCLCEGLGSFSVGLMEGCSLGCYYKSRGSGAKVYRVEKA